MKEKTDISRVLDLMIRPGFLVKNNLITQVNPAAQALLVLPGTDVRTLLLTGQQEYSEFTQGGLYLQLSLSSGGCGATVIRQEDADLFCLEPDSADDRLRCLALAARELRQPLTGILISTDQLSKNADDASREQALRLRRGVYQLQRIIDNMSDASRSIPSHRELRNVCAVLDGIMEKAGTLVAHTGIRLTWQGLQEEILTQVDGELLERAVLNLLSNALKFTPQGGLIEASLTRRGQMLQLSIQDNGSGIDDGILSSVFSRYLRQAGIEDSRHGLGLGMVMVRSAAAAHGGTVLIHRPAEGGTRITMTLAIRTGECSFHCPVLQVDYTGGQDPFLLELSGNLPLSAFDTNFL